jgi:hypothetical protein
VRVNPIKSPMVSVSAQARNIPAPFQVRVLATADEAELAEILDDLAVYGRTIYDTMRDSPTIKNMMEVAGYSGMLARAAEVAATIRSGGVRPKELGNATPETLQQLLDKYAYLVSGNLTKIKKGAHFSGILDGEEQDELDKNFPRGKVLDENQTAYVWATMQGIGGVMSRTVTLIEKWAQVRKLEQRLHGGKAKGQMGAYEAVMGQVMDGETH